MLRASCCVGDPIGVSPGLPGHAHVGVVKAAEHRDRSDPASFSESMAARIRRDRQVDALVQSGVVVADDESADLVLTDLPKAPQDVREAGPRDESCLRRGRSQPRFLESEFVSPPAH